MLGLMSRLLGKRRLSREYVPLPEHFESEEYYVAALDAWRRWSRERS